MIRNNLEKSNLHTRCTLKKARVHSHSDYQRDHIYIQMLDYCRYYWMIIPCIQGESDGRKNIPSVLGQVGCKRVYR